MVTLLLGNIQPGLQEAGIPPRDLVLQAVGGQSLTTLLGPSSGWWENLGTQALPPPLPPPSSQQPLFWPET